MRPSVVPPPPLPISAAARGADAEQRHVVQDVVALIESDLTTSEDLSPRSTGRQVHLAHVDLRAELIVHAAGIVDLRSEAEVHAEIDAAFLALRFERRERRKETGANRARSSRSHPSGTRPPANAATTRAARTI